MPADAGAAEIAALAGELCGVEVTEAQPCGAGGNNRVYRVQTVRGPLAAKVYGAPELSGGERLRHEFDGLHFLNGAGAGGRVPKTIAADRARGCALYEWIDGTAATQHSVKDVEAALELLSVLHAARDLPDAKTLLPATEAVLRLRDLLDQIEMRVARLANAAESDAPLAEFLHEEVEPELRGRRDALKNWDLDAALARELQTLSPSDFGFHNALRRPGGSLAFIDFEYFGWDDPVKLTADFLWHPAMRLNAAERRRFLAGTRELYGSDAGFAKRLAVCYPLYGIRWTLIILNEFLPQLWARRAFAGKGRDWEASKREQLAKARATLADVHSYDEGTLTP